MKTVSLLLVVCILVGGCALTGYEGPISGKTYYREFMSGRINPGYWIEVRQDYINQNPTLDKRFIRIIKAGEITQGMTEEMVIASWCESECSRRTSRSVHRYGTSTIFTYGDYRYGGKPTYVFFENGKVTGWSY